MNAIRKNVSPHSAVPQLFLMQDSATDIIAQRWILSANHQITPGLTHWRRGSGAVVGQTVPLWNPWACCGMKGLQSAASSRIHPATAADKWLTTRVVRLFPPAPYPMYGNRDGVQQHAAVMRSRVQVDIYYAGYWIHLLVEWKIGWEVQVLRRNVTFAVIFFSNLYLRNSNTEVALCQHGFSIFLRHDWGSDSHLKSSSFKS